MHETMITVKASKMEEMKNIKRLKKLGFKEPLWFKRGKLGIYRVG